MGFSPARATLGSLVCGLFLPQTASSSIAMEEEEEAPTLVGGAPRPGEALALGGGLGPAFWLDAKRLAFPTGAGACVLDVQRGTQVRVCTRPPASCRQPARDRPGRLGVAEGPADDLQGVVERALGLVDELLRATADDDGGLAAGPFSSA